MLTVFFAALFMTLGNWQLNRAAEKQALIDQHRRVAMSEPVTLPGREEVTNHADAWRYRPVREAVEWQSERQFLLDNKVHARQAGYHVLTPARIVRNGEWVLVNRGWVPQGKTRRDLPDVRIPESPKTPETIIRGDIYPPFPDAYRTGVDMAGGATGWPLVIQYIDFEAIGKLLGAPVLPFVVRLSPEENNPGFVRIWPTVPFSPEKHIAYAWQWFAMAGVILILFFFLNIKRKHPEAPENRENNGEP